MKGYVCSIIAGFKTTNGILINTSESAPKFFGYKKMEFETITTINELMPTAISVNHNKIFNRLIESGIPKTIRKYRMAVGKFKNGYIFPINIFVNYYW